MWKFLTCLAAVLLVTPVFAADDFHPPKTPGEKALDKILKSAPHIRLDTPYQEHSKIVTQPLFEAIQAAEKQQVETECGGKYVEGEACGLDYNPITCAQDSTEGYLVRTLGAAAIQQIIEYKLPDTDKAVAQYRLLKIKGHWEIDGINCPDVATFHWKKLSAF